jgi:hypothetical protein
VPDIFQPSEPPSNGGFLPWHEFGELLNQNVPTRLRRECRSSPFFEVREVLSQMIERLKKIWRRQGSASMVLAGSAPLGGCARVGFEQTKTPVMVSEVILMSKEGVPAETIVKKMRDSKSVYRLTAAQLAYLHDQGVADRIINYMQQTYLEAVRREQNLADWNTREMWGDHFW